MSNRFGDSVELYDLRTNARKFTVSNMHAPHSVAVGTDGVLYVPNSPSLDNGVFPPNITPIGGFGGDSIEKFDATTGKYLGRFASAAMPFSLAWGPDKNLYASSALELALTVPNSDAVRRFNGSTGQLQGVVARGTKIPFDLLFMPDGMLLVSEFLSNRIQMYNPTTGALVKTFAQVSAPIGLAIGPDGDLYVGSNSDPLGPLSNPPRPNRGRVLRLNAQTGAVKGVFVTMAPGLEYAAFVRFAPSA